MLPDARQELCSQGNLPPSDSYEVESNFQDEELIFLELILLENDEVRTQGVC